MNVEIIPNPANGEEDEEEVEAIIEESQQQQPHHHDDDEGTTITTATVIENIDSILNTEDADNSNNNNNNDEEGISAAISDDTSATSLASTLSDGISRPRPRSASLQLPFSSPHHPTTNAADGNNNDNGSNNRPSSIPRIRPRSNPRTRTPMRQASPLLVISPIVATSTAAAAAAAAVDAAVATGEQLLGGGANNDDEEENERLIRNIFHTRSGRGNNGGGMRRTRASSIPEEVVDEDADEDDATSMIAIVDNNIDSTVVNNDNGDAAVAAAVNTDNNQAIHQAQNEHNDITSPPSSTTTTTTRTAGRFFTQAVVASTTNQHRRNNRTTTESTPNQQQQRTLSTKQNPSHRKIRRWKNDAFIGTPFEHVHTMLLLGGGDDGNNNNNSSNDKRWNEFPYMPNYPLQYKSEFQKLLTMDKSKGGEKVREKFVRGEVASVDVAWRNNNVGDEEEEELDEDVRMYQRIVTKCHQMGISPKQQHQLATVKDNEIEWGKVLYNKLGLRIQSVLSRSCSSFDTSASGIVSSFESYLVSLALHSKVMDNDGNDGDDDEGEGDVGFPPLQSQVVYDTFNGILASPPRIVIRNKQHQQQHSSSSPFKSNFNKQRVGNKGSTTAATKEVSNMNQCGVLIPTIHFYFPTEQGQDDDGSGSGKRSSAFHRILLYAVCQFHGLETTSSFVVPEKKKKKAKKKMDNGRRGRGRQKKQTQDVQGGSTVKVVTVQGGVLLAPSVKLLDFVCT